MRIAIVGNLSGVGIRRAWALRHEGWDAHLFVSAYEADVSDPREGLPGATHRWTWLARPEWRNAGGSLRLLRSAAIATGIVRTNVDLLRYDVVHSIGSNVVYGLGVHRPLVAEPLGADIIEVAPRRGVVPFLMRAGWRHAGALIFPTGEVMRAAERLGLTAHFVPLALETDLFHPGAEPRNDRLALFAPTRHDWGPGRQRMKANDVLLRGVARFVQDGGNVELRTIAHGPDLPASRRLVRELGIERHVAWLPARDREQLLAEYQRADVVADQFQFGSFGQVSLEGFACGKPVITHYDDDYTRSYGERPVYLQADTPDAVAAALAAANDPAVRRALGAAAREWVLRHHSPGVVARALLAVYRAVA